MFVPSNDGCLFVRQPHTQQQLLYRFLYTVCTGSTVKCDHVRQFKAVTTFEASGNFVFRGLRPHSPRLISPNFCRTSQFQLPCKSRGHFFSYTRLTHQLSAPRPPTPRYYFKGHQSLGLGTEWTATLPPHSLCRSWTFGTVSPSAHRQPRCPHVHVPG